MKPLDAYNPFVTFSYFLAVTFVVMFSMNPILILFSFLGALSLFFMKIGGKGRRFPLVCAGLFLLIALVNPLFQHDGATVLVVLNGNPITWEAIFYGMTAGLMTVTVLYWFRLLSDMMTGDKYLYVFGIFSAKLALLLSMAMRYVPLFGARMKEIRTAQKGMGLYREDTLLDKLRGEMRIFSVMVTWCLENGIHTADSMEARGYGTGRRTRFSLFSMGRSDWLLLFVMVGFLAVTVTGFGMGALSFDFYPALRFGAADPLAWASYGAYGIFCFLPTVLEGEDRVKWHFLRSNI